MHDFNWIDGIVDEMILCFHLDIMKMECEDSQIYGIGK